MFEEIVGASPSFVAWKDKLHGQAPKPNHLYFTDKWPGSSWKNDKFFEIVNTRYEDYPRSFTIPGNDYKEIDLSNATGGMKLYPASEGKVHEILVSMSPGNYYIQIDVPNGKPLSRLPEASMVPAQTGTVLKYLNAKFPENSPPRNPSIKFWTIYEMEAITFRLMTLSGQDFERATFHFTVAMHTLKKLDGKPVGVYDTIPFVTEEQ